MPLRDASDLADHLAAARQAAQATGRALIDCVDLTHGPREELGQFFLLADEDARQLGVQVLLHTDMASLVRVNEALRPVWGFPIIPVFNPAYHALTSQDSFWLSGHDEAGLVVATQASRLIDMSGTTALEELRTQRLLYSDPRAEIEAGSSIEVEGDAVDAAAGVGGRVIYNGGAWHDRSVRGRGLSHILPRIARNLAYTRWRPDWCITLIETVLAEKRIHRRYGYVHHAPYVRLAGRYRTIEAHFAWIAGDQILGDLMGYVAARTGMDTRMVADEDRNRAPLLRQGSSNRS